MTSYITSIRYVFCDKCKSSIISHSDYIDQKRRNEEAKDYIPIKIFNKNIMLNAIDFVPKSIDDY